ncbi:putative uncharacterized protein DDB_G0286901 isoform X2 [Episyrphus balteatus]|uniref:putative uncharacterized protein DDB_G0286901 isoform X2 n=1 Tax=Episyrphus balteatus TaxID=286459 RepID=UPI0024854AF8|nr:putative uncharacterized protein DDB_G0286901 isoform X2 [Episyrphus balteatus]
MALSCLSHPNFTDLQTFLDPIRSSFDFSTINNDQMEYHNNNSTAINQHLTHSNNNNNSNNNRNYNNFAANQTQNAFNNDYDQVINFVDSPPNSEESWTDEQHQQQQTQQQQQQQQQQNGKIPTAGPRIIDVQTIFGQQQQQQQQQQQAAAAVAQRKRRMDWNPLEINQNGNSGTDSQSTAAKIPNLTNGNANNNNNNNNTTNNTINKEKEKKKISNGNGSGRGSWADDIDFDLNGDFNSTGYLNNEPFLSFSPALTVLKQEIHSPQADQLKGSKSPLNQENSLSSDNHDTEQHQVNGTTPDLNESNASCGSPSSHQVVAAKSGYDNSKPITINGFSVNNQQQQQQQTDKSLINARKSPIQPIADSSKSENSSSLADDYKFQYILAAATSIATKNNEETLTYLNQGQSYEIKLKKTGDLSFYRDKILKSVIKICFHERRLQYMEREQMQQWQASRPGERIIEVDVPLSYGLCHVSQPLNQNFLNTVEVFWDPLKEVGVYIKVNCISTEFTPKKHGGEKGVPFRIQIETYIENANNSPVGGDSTTNCNNLVVGGGGGGGVGTSGVGGGSAGGSGGLIGKQAIHAAACQIKVFKLKGADRKHKQDREKIQRRPVSEQEKFQPSYECTIMNDIPLDTLPSSAGCYSPEYMKLWPNSPVHIPKYDGIIPYANVSPTANSSPIAINSVTSTNTNNLKLMDANMVSPQQVEMDDYQSPNIMAESTPAQVTQWLTYHRLTTYVSTFAHFSGSDILRMSKEDLIQICGLADGIRMFNILHAKAIAPRLTIYISLDGNSYNAIYLTSNLSKELSQKIFKLPGFYELSANSSNMNGGVDGGVYPGWGMQSKYSGSGSNIFNDASKTPVYITGPSGVHVTITDEVLNNEIKDGSLFALEVQNGKVLMKAVNKNDN